MDIQVKSAIVAICIVIPLTSLAVWASDQPSVSPIKTSEKIQVTTSFYPLYDFTKKIAGPDVDVYLLVPPGVEPHDWEPSIKDIQQIQNSDLLVINGLGFENWLTEIELENSNVIIVDSSKRQNDQTILTDSHIWLSPIKAKNQVTNIAYGLAIVDPENTNQYLENAEILKTKLDLLDSKIRAELKDCAREFITFHDSFSIFAKEYGLIQQTITKSNDSHAEPTSKNIQRLIDLAKNRGINVIFTEEGVDPRSSQVIANEIDGKVMTLSPLEISDDNQDYFQKMEQNLDSLKEALCK